MLIGTALVLAIGPQPAPSDAQVKELLEQHCTGCHGAGDDLDLSKPPASLLEAKASGGQPMVVAGDPSKSYLWTKMVGGAGMEGEQMPMGGDPLSAAELEPVKAWIMALGGEGGADDANAGDPTAAPTNDAPATESQGAAPSNVSLDGKGRRKRPKKWWCVGPKAVSRTPFGGTHQIALHTTTTLGCNVIEFRVHHRFGQVGKPGDRNYLGLASGAVMSLGMAYGIIDGLDIMARWSNSQLDWEIGTKYVPVRQEANKPVSFGMYASFEALGVEKTAAANRFTGNFQAMLSRLWADRWATQLTVNYSMLTNHAPVVILDLGDGPQQYKDKRGTLFVALASTVLLGKKRKHGIDLEYIFPIPDGRDGGNVFYYNGGDARPAPLGARGGSWSLGWSVKTGLHFFQVFVSNTRNIHTNLVAPGGDFENPFKPFGDFVIGFNLSRKWKL